MKRNITTVITLVMLGLFCSCEKDNLDFSPNATFSGEVVDLETGEPLQQDVLEGSMIYFIELGWNNAPVQSMVIKNDGTFRNNLMFSGDYQIIMNKGNYIPLDTLDYRMRKRDNTHTFEVIPYLRITNTDIKFRDGKVIAKFRLKQLTKDPVKSISLFAHSDISVGHRIQLESVTHNLNSHAEDIEYEISMPINDDSKLSTGNSYYFRIGALSTASEAKYNYATAVNVDL